MTEQLQKNLREKIAYASHVREGGPEHATLLSHIPTLRILFYDALTQVIKNPPDPSKFGNEANMTPLDEDTPPIPEVTGQFLHHELLKTEPSTLKLAEQSSRRQLMQSLLETTSKLADDPDNLAILSLPTPDDIASLLVLDDNGLSPTRPDPISNTLSSMRMLGMFDPTKIPGDYDPFVIEMAHPVWGDIHTYIRKTILEHYELERLRLQTRGNISPENTLPSELISRSKYLFPDNENIYQNLLLAGQIKTMCQTMTDHGVDLTNLTRAISSDNLPLDQLLTELIRSSPSRLTEVANAVSFDFAIFAKEKLSADERAQLLNLLNHPTPPDPQTAGLSPIEQAGLVYLSPNPAQF